VYTPYSPCMSTPLELKTGHARNEGLENVAPECTGGKLDINYTVLPEKRVDVMGFKPE